MVIENDIKYKKEIDGFYGLGIAPQILDTLERIKFRWPTPIQQKVIPLAIQGKDIIGVAQTGTGKTHSFAIPMVQGLAQKRGIGVVLAPTRELAIQIVEAYKVILSPFGIKMACLIGGSSMHRQMNEIRKNPRIIIATPGRIIDHLKRRNIHLKDTVMLVLDEADRMLDMGFAPQVEKILTFVPKERQTMLFSATIPKEIMDMVRRHMKLPVSVEIEPSGTTAKNVTQELFIVKKDAKLQLLNKMLQQYLGPVLVFSRTKHNAGRLARSIRGLGHSATEIHSDRSMHQRREALEGFKSGKYRVLIATDIAARGIDVIGIELVVNFDLPDDTQNYVHRIGRTGRAGHKGHAISFATPDQKRDVRDIEKLINTALPLSKHDNITHDKFYGPQKVFSSFRRFRSRRFGKRRF